MEFSHAWLDNIDQLLLIARKEAVNTPRAFMNMAISMQYIITQADNQLPMFLEFRSQARRDPNIW